MSNLPTIEQMFTNATANLDRAYAALGDAADWLRSDWKPVGTQLTRAQSEQKRRMFAAIAEAKKAINEAKS